MMYTTHENGRFWGWCMVLRFSINKNHPAIVVPPAIWKALYQWPFQVPQLEAPVTLLYRTSHSWGFFRHSPKASKSSLALFLGQSCNRDFSSLGRFVSGLSTNQLRIYFGGYLRLAMNLFGTSNRSVPTMASDLCSSPADEQQQAAMEMHAAHLLRTDGRRWVLQRGTDGW